MGNLTSRETKQLLDNELFKQIATSLGHFLHQQGEHERSRAARHRRKIAWEEAELARQRQIFYHYHHHFDPSNPRQNSGGGVRNPQGHLEESPFAVQEQHAGRQDIHYNGHAPSHPQDQQHYGHPRPSNRRHGRQSEYRQSDSHAGQHLDHHLHGAMASSPVVPFTRSPRPSNPRAHQPRSGSERGGARQSRSRRSRPPMQRMQTQGPAAAGPPRGRQPPMRMGPYPANQPYYTGGGHPEVGDNGGFGDEGDEGEDEDGEDGTDGPGAGGAGMGGGGAGGMVPGGAMGAEGGMEGYREGFGPERGMRRGRRQDRHDGLGPDQRPE